MLSSATGGCQRAGVGSDNGATPFCFCVRLPVREQKGGRLLVPYGIPEAEFLSVGIKSSAVNRNHTSAVSLL